MGPAVPCSKRVFMGEQHKNTLSSAVPEQNTAAIA